MIVNAEIDGERLSHVEFDMFWILLLVAGNETTRNLISGGLLALLEHADEQARLWADPNELLASGVNEMLRWVSPVNCFRRTATADTTVGGQPVAAGEKVVVFYGAANRDPRVFPEPHRFDLGRPANDQVAFGFGPHYCLGANLARLQAREFYSALTRFTRSVELTGDVRRTRSALINGLDSLPVEVRS